MYYTCLFVCWMYMYEYTYVYVCMYVLYVCMYVQCHGDDPDVIINYAAVAFKEGNYESARTQYSEAINTMGMYVCMYIFMFWLSLYALFLFLFVVYILSYNHTFTCIHTYIHFLCSSGYQADLAYNVALCYYREKEYGKAVNLYAYIHTCMHTVINMKYMHTYISLMYIDWLSCMYVCMYVCRACLEKHCRDYW